MKKKILILSQVVIFAIFLSLNINHTDSKTEVSLGGMNAFAEDNPCGICDFTNPDIPLGFCNYISQGGCGGNNGYICGSVPCQN